MTAPRNTPLLTDSKSCMTPTGQSATASIQTSPMLAGQKQIRAALSDFVRDDVADAEQGEPDREHPVHAEERRVPVVRRQGSTDLVVGDDRQVDQEGWTLPTPPTGRTP